MRLRLQLDPTATGALGACFMCERDHLTVVTVGVLTNATGPGHSATEIPVDACRACEGRLLLLLADAQRPLVRPYVAAVHPHRLPVRYTPLAGRSEGPRARA
ncbi:hypothetical protein [Streptomyces sp. NPDC059883]|uniref:hypothetical protein n=1 Tax=unclassified Streptomyces TaxID=2593676 RepID=UPI0036698462